MSDFMNRYTTRAKEKKSMLCFGLDPTPAQIPPKYGSGTNISCVTRYVMDCIDVAADLCACVKPQWGFWHAFGARGYSALEDIVEYAHERGLLVIEDAKPSDIGNTVDAYGVGFFKHHCVDAVTFSPYLGLTFLPTDDDLKKLWFPHLDEGRGVIPMILTSNDERDQLQTLRLQDGRFIYSYMAELVASCAERVDRLTNGHGMIGGVVGATVPAEAVEIRTIVGDKLPFLVPGLGAQGATGLDAIAGMPASGEPVLIINNSRGLFWDPWYDRKTKKIRDGDPLELVRAAAKANNSQINNALVEKFGSLEKVYG